MTSGYFDGYSNKKSIDPRVKQVMKDSGCSLDEAIAMLNLDPDDIFDQDAFHMYLDDRREE